MPLADECWNRWTDLSSAHPEIQTDASAGLIVSAQSGRPHGSRELVLLD
jgi:hypothetical protein